LQKVNALNQIAVNHGCTLSQLALKWVLKDNDLTSVLIGASRPSQIIDNAGIVGIAPLSADELAEIERVCAI
jgi:L-glyceraldehyde 3-phosphate reductase